MTVGTQVWCDLEFGVAGHVELALQVAVARTAGTLLDDQLTVTLDDAPVDDVSEHGTDHGGRTHVLRCGAGLLRVAYRARVEPAPPPERPVDPVEAIIARRQSRYCPSDALDVFAPAELGEIGDDEERGRAVAAWVHRRLVYEPGASGPLDTAVDTLLAGHGVCRDFAHLTVTLCRAIGVPARLVSAYAPGLYPMDFHAVAEVAPAGRWEVVDATRLAPRPSLVRIATGRDASDTAFATTLAGGADLWSSTIGAIVDGDLPIDDHGARATLA